MRNLEEEVRENQRYIEMLKIMASLSRLYSESNIPFLYYRVTENLFCRYLRAQNLSRSDTAYDAKWNDLGIGIKTFILNSNRKIEKIAEFNALSSQLVNVRGLDLAWKLADFRNERIEIANRLYGIRNSCYHIIGRDENILKVFNTPYEKVDKDSLRVLSDNNKVLKFVDSRNQYSFNRSKSVLMKEFNLPADYLQIDVDIIEDPFDLLENIRRANEVNQPIGGEEYVILPLYSTRNGEKYVPSKSGLNQWNANGRSRNEDEVYVRIPAYIHSQNPNFFPSRNESFELKLPDGSALSAKVCQQGDKALMSNPNSALGNWILRNVLNISPGELVTYQDLEIAGFDSLLISKIGERIYKVQAWQSDSDN